MKQPILIFDSGLGGLSIYKKLKQTLSSEVYYYVSDSKNLPYGELNDTQLIELCLPIIMAYVNRLNPQLIVLACNTASTLLLPYLRAQLSLPIVGVIPAIKPAAQATQTKHIALLATPATISRNYTQDLIHTFAKDCHVQKIGSSELVQLAEHKVRHHTFCTQTLKQIIDQVDPKNDVLVLGCTHFPLLKTEIESLLPKSIRTIDSGDAIVNRVETLIHTSNDASIQQPDTYCDTQNISTKLKENLKHLGFEHFQTYVPNASLFTPELL